MTGAFDTETVGGVCRMLAVCKGGSTAVGAVESFEDVLAMLGQLSGCRPVWAFNLDYDARAIFALLPREKVRSLYLRHPVEFRGVELDYLPGKFLRIGRIRCFDLWQFFECGLDAACRRVGLSGKASVPLRSLLSLGRMRVGSRAWARIAEYCAQDARSTWELGEYLIDSMRSAGVESEDWFSAGYLAKRVLSACHRCRPVVVPELVESSYYGGRVEVFRRGSFPRAYGYDVNSAYPYAITRLPDLCVGRLVKLSRPNSEIKPWFGLGRVWTAESSIQPFPIRTSRGLVFPRLRGAKIPVSWIEFEVADRAGLVERVEWETVYGFVGTGARPWARLIRRLYRKKQAGGPSRLATKKLLNSCYGVFAETRREFGARVSEERIDARFRRVQSVELVSLNLSGGHSLGCECSRCAYARRLRRIIRPGRLEAVLVGGRFYRTKRVSGRLRQPFYAACITAECRAQLLSAMLSAPDAIIACATDGILSLERLPVRVGDGLGEWAESAISNLVIVSPGIYEFEQGGELKTRFRGVERSLKLSSLLRRAGSRRSVVVRVRRPAGLLEYLNRGEPLNEFRPRKLELRFEDWRRRWPAELGLARYLSESQNSVPIVLDRSGRML